MSLNSCDASMSPEWPSRPLVNGPIGAEKTVVDSVQVSAILPAAYREFHVVPAVEFHGLSLASDGLPFPVCGFRDLDILVSPRPEPVTALVRLSGTMEDDDESIVGPSPSNLALNREIVVRKKTGHRGKGAVRACRYSS